jgi:hypothetical protein
MRQALTGLAAEDFDFAGPLGSQGAWLEALGVNHFRVTLGAAPGHPEWANMLQFTLRRARGNSLRLDVRFHGGNQNRFNTYFQSWSYDGIHWLPIQWEQGYRPDADSAAGDSLVFPRFEHDTVYVGHQVPLSHERLTQLLHACAERPEARLTSLGDSTGGRAIWRLTVTGDRSPVPVAERRVHYFANQHPGEHNARWRMLGMIQWLLGPRAREFRSRNVCHFVPMMSPDAHAAGWYRVNAAGVDMNRSYCISGADPDRQTPEACLVQRDLEAVAASGRLASFWSHHTCIGKVLPVVLAAPDMASRVGTPERMAGSIRRQDPRGDLCEPLRVGGPRDTAGATCWTYGPYKQLGVTSFLIEGGGLLFTQTQNVTSGAILMRALAEAAPRPTA